MTKTIERLETIRQLNAESGWVNQKLYKLMTHQDLYEVAYQRIKSNPGNMTPGTDDETLDGFSLEGITKIIEEMRTEKYQCKPVRRTYIPKSNGKLRKLGIPCVRDKVIQEVVRMILEAVYDSSQGSYFKDNSNGFRRERSCHTALRDVRRQWTGVTWIIEGDIKNCFDDVDHETLIDILREKISDERFLNLIKKILGAGYLDLDEIRKDSLAGTPQGGIVSPILSNIYLHKLDEFVEQKRAELERGQHRKHNLEYKRIQDRKLYMAKAGKTKSQEFRELDKRMKQLPSMDVRDPNFVRIKYVRYADDWMIGVIGPRELAERLKQEIKDFLSTNLKLTLSEEKTIITNAHSQEAKFLGYKVKVGRTLKEQKQKMTRNRWRAVKKRTTGNEVILRVPMNELLKRLQTKGFCDANGKPKHRAPWMLLDDDQIVLLYSSINRGLQEFYRPADDFYRLTRIQYILKSSLAKTLAAKHRSSTKKVIRGGEIRVRVKRGDKVREIVFWQNKDWTTQRDAFAQSKKVDLVRMNLRMRTRSKLGWPCCICGDADHVQMHHVRHIRKMGEKRATGFTRVMDALNRKQIPVCERCHKLIHAGEYDGLSIRDLTYDPRRETSEEGRRAIK